MNRFLSWATVVVVMVLMVCALMFLFYVTDAGCRARGGHTEVVYGGRGGWTCSGGGPP